MTLVCPSCAVPIEHGAEVCLACGRSLSALAIGSVLANRYELRAVLGKGGMGLVYRAFDRLLEEEVAIKVLRTDLSANPDTVRRFRGEIKLARKVSHPNVCRIHDYGEQGPLGYISMEILAGQDLQKTIKENPAGLPEGEAISAMLQIAAGLQAIHDVGILHRDLKTANATRDERGVVRLVDFGIAKDLLSEGQTAAGEAFGTPEYMSPEQCRGDALDFRSDVYALGVLAFELFTGELPLKGSTPIATLYKQLQESPSFDAGAGLRVPRGCVPVLKKALAKAAADRHASAQEFAQALRNAAIADRPATSPTPRPEPTASDRPSTEAHIWVPGQTDARRDERIYLPTDVLLKKLGPEGSPLKEERTVAHDLSRSGMRILTSWSDLEKGDKVKVVEVGGDFSTGAIVRNVSRGTDHITRVGIEFLDQRAPDRLVGTGNTSSGGPKAASPGSPARHSGPSPAVADSQRFTPGARSAIPTPNPPAPRPSGDRPSGERATFNPPRGPRGVQEEIARARQLISESRLWEALQSLTIAQELAQGTREGMQIRIMIAETQALNPALIRAAQLNLEDLSHHEPKEPLVHAALGRIYRSAGLIREAHGAFDRVLSLDPTNQEAANAIAELKRAASGPR